VIIVDSWLLYEGSECHGTGDVVQLPVEEDIDLDDVFLDEDVTQKTEL